MHRSSTFEISPFELNAQPLEMRWVNPENPTGERSAGGRTGYGRKGSPCLMDLRAGQSWTMAEGNGMGTIRRIWITSTERLPEALRGLVIRFFWDGARTPAVEAPLGDFFACPLGRMTAFASEWFDTAEGRNFNCRLPMPFRKSFKVTVTNESPVTHHMFWYHLDYTLGDKHHDGTGYLHAHYRRENPTTLRRDFEILPRVEGRGRYLGASLGIISNMREYGRSWWGEGEVKIFLDGDGDFPTLCGTGAEDYICTSWGQGQYSLPWYGCQLADAAIMQYAMYRFHGFDPIFFQREIRVTIQQIGYCGDDELLVISEQSGRPAPIRIGDGTQRITFTDRQSTDLFEREDDWSATAYFYLDQPENSLPPIQPYEHRVAGLSCDGNTNARMDA